MIFNQITDWQARSQVLKVSHGLARSFSDNYYIPKWFFWVLGARPTVRWRSWQSKIHRHSGCTLIGIIAAIYMRNNAILGAVCVIILLLNSKWFLWGMIASWTDCKFWYLIVKMALFSDFSITLLKKQFLKSAEPSKPNV